MGRKRTDLAGQKFGKLTVLEWTGQRHRCKGETIGDIINGL